MCGITGVYHSSRQQTTESVVRSMTESLAHRGPDESSFFVDQHVALGFRRLSIIDVAGGHQPIAGIEEESLLLCNGEIYNYKELRSELQAKGYRFRTDCDVEVIVHLYREYGTGFLNRLNGQFSFVIYDKKKNLLFLARDQFGICPLFYTWAEGVFVFGSEIRAILRHPLVKREVDLQGIDQILSFPGLVSPTTMFRDIHSLAPGHYMLVGRDRPEIRAYWDLEYPLLSEESDKPETYYVDQLEDLLARSVRYRLNADVPVGFYLSGGLDSSLIGAMIKAVAPDKTYPSFSISFPLDGDMDECRHQQCVARHLKLNHTSIPFDSTEIERRLVEAVWAAESPLKESYNTCSLALAEAVSKRGIKAVLSGEGADELFGGYIGYRLDQQRKVNAAVQDLEGQLEEDYRERLWGDADFFYEKNYYQFDEMKCGLYAAAARERFPSFSAVRNLTFDKSKIRGRHVLHKRSYIDLKLRLSDHLISDHCDRVAYHYSVEGRYPFLDIDLMEFIRTIPPRLKLNGSMEKYILKKMAGKYLPDQIVHREKFGFVAPGSPSLLNKDIEWINDLLSYERIRRQGYFDPDTVERLKKGYSDKRFRLNLPFDSDILMIVLTFGIFLELFEMPNYS